MKRPVIFYFIILFLAVVLRTSVAAPNVLVRLVFLCAFFIPFLTRYRNLYLPCLVAFTTVSINSFAFGYFPYDMFSYAVMSIFVLVVSTLIHHNHVIKIKPLFFIILLYAFIINVVCSGAPENITYCIISVCCGVLLLDDNEKMNQNNMLNCFSVISLALSFIYLTNYETFLESYNASDGMERSGWTDPNYLSCIIGMGVVASLIRLLREKGANVYLRLFLITTIIMSLMSQLLLASRGGILCVVISSSVLIIFTDVRKSYKFIISFLLIGVLIWLYTSGYFELLEYRISDDSTGGSGRVDIWKMKLSVFAQKSNIINWFFGVGHTRAFQLSYNNQAIGFHNDFLAILCSYGIIGLGMLVYMMFVLPFKRTTRSSRPIVIALVIYLALACITLEPLSSGRLTYFAFYYLILLSRSIS